MRTRTLFALAPLTLALSALAGTRAQAQGRALVTVCRDGTQLTTGDSRLCASHGGVDAQATQNARTYKSGPSDNRNGNSQYPTRKYGTDTNNTETNGTYDNRRSDDQRTNDGRDRDGRWNNNGNNGNNNGNNGNYNNGNNGNYNNGNYNNGSYNTGSTEVYEWQGRVDSEIRLQLAGSRAVVQRIGRSELRQPAGRLLSSLPRQDGTLSVQTLQGRGSVDVIQQPTSSNGYTAIIRLRDTQSGAADYHLVAYWQPTGTTNNGRYNGHDNGRHNGRRP
jgi:hypothetical protein